MRDGVGIEPKTFEPGLNFVATEVCRLLWFNLVRVEICELRPKVVAEGEGVLVHYRSRTNVQCGLPSKALA